MNQICVHARSHIPCIVSKLIPWSIRKPGGEMQNYSSQIRSQLVIISPKCYQQKWFLGISFLRSRFTLNFTDKFNLIAKKMQIMFPVLHTGKITHAHVACTRSYLLLRTRLVSDMLHLHVTLGRLCGRDVLSTNFFQRIIAFALLNT